MKNIYLIRHGESESNAGNQTKDNKSTSLTEFGLYQAATLCDKLIFQIDQNDLIVTSSYLRSKQTAETLIKKIGFQNSTEEWEVQEFSYLSPKQYFETNMEQRKPFVERYWKSCDPFYNDGDGAESFHDMIDRIDRTILKIKSSDKQSIFIFTHGQFMKAFLWIVLCDETKFEKWLKYPPMKDFIHFMRRIDIANCGILKFQLDEENNLIYKI